uniref:RO-1 n=1 Tax=Romalea microptera TaxID=7007 RepID=HTF1_ROMMI|nr:RecName: Full=RO-1; AltName: Full=Hypertrehalosaemic factor; AltName: Full=RO I [Romalea microptera]
QVNFTPNWGT